MKRDKEEEEQEIDPRFHPLMSPDISTWEDVRWETDPKQGGKLTKIVTLFEARSPLDPKRLTFGHADVVPAATTTPGSRALSSIHEVKGEEDEEEVEWKEAHDVLEVFDVGSVEWKEAQDVLGGGKDLNMSDLADLVQELHLVSKSEREFERMAAERFPPYYNKEEVFRPGFVTPQLQSEERYNEDDMREMLNRALGQARKARTLSTNNLFIALFLPHIALDAREFYGTWKVSTDLEDTHIAGETLVKLGKIHVVALKYRLTPAKEFQMGPLLPVRLSTVHPDTLFAFEFVFEPVQEVWNPIYASGSKDSTSFPAGITRIFVVVASEAKNGLIHMSRTLALYRQIIK